MNKEEAVSYILDIPKFTAKNSLEHTREFLARLGNPQNKRKILHVAGTNGKGSVCAYMQAVLLAEGKSVGMFISPHLEKINERIKIQGSDISDESFLEVFGRVKRTVDEMTADGLPHPTFFEFLFGMAMTAFAEADVEYVILETGLGGRLDATNAVEHPFLTVITSISLDHTEILGETIEEITAEKAGIIKNGVPVVFADGTESSALIEKTAGEKHAPCIKISKNAYKIMKIGHKYIDFSTASAYDKYTEWELHNTGIYQADNAMLAIKAMEYVFPEKCSLDKWRQALCEVVWPGRMEEICPDVIVDGAHNPGAIREFVRSAGQAEKKKTIVLFSAVREKDYEDMSEYLCRNLDAACYVITEVKSDRGVGAAAMAEIFRRYTDAEVVTEPDLKRAFETALQKKGKEGRVYCLGSLYLVGMLKELTGGRDHAQF